LPAIKINFRAKLPFARHKQKACQPQRTFRSKRSGRSAGFFICAAGVAQPIIAVSDSWFDFSNEIRDVIIAVSDSRFEN
jgi:hypothetical protein